MRHESKFPGMNEKQLAALGAGHIAYLREMTGEQVAKAFPGAPGIEADRKVWALFAADGSPLALAEDAGGAISAAFESQLVPVAVH